MKVTFLGTGTSHGVPVIGCDCEVCTSLDPKDNRTRSSVMIENENTRFVIDTGPDFRQQMLREKVKWLNAIVFTHEHKDHTAGLDDVRAFNFYSDKAIDIYASQRVIDNLIRSFEYIFKEHKYPGIPRVELHTIGNKLFNVGDITLIPLILYHHKLTVTCYRINDFVYITDVNNIPVSEREKIEGCKILVLNALRVQPHIAHFSLEEAVAMAVELKAEKVYFTHISHQLGKHKEINNILPENMELAYDGLTLEI